MSKTKTDAAPKSRVLTPKEIELADGLSAAMAGKMTAVADANAYRREIARLTREINKLDYARSMRVWAEAREKLGAPPAPTREQLTKGT